MKFFLFLQVCRHSVCRRKISTKRSVAFDIEMKSFFNTYNKSNVMHTSSKYFNSLEQEEFFCGKHASRPRGQVTSSLYFPLLIHGKRSRRGKVRVAILVKPILLDFIFFRIVRDKLLYINHPVFS